MAKCFYCGKRSTERDHFPIPRCATFIDTVPICTKCHYIKDKIELFDWDEKFIQKIKEDYDNSSIELKLFIGKLFLLIFRERTVFDLRRHCKKLIYPWNEIARFLNKYF